MKKRIFGTLLMGALFVSSMSTFVSCKDYDDDINSLQTQINSLSSLLDTKEATINNTLNAIQAQLSSLSSLEATLKGQISDGDAATLAAARQAVADAQAALQAAINTNKSELVAANAAQDAAILEAKTAADQALAQLAQLSSTMQPLVESITQDIAAAQAGLTQVQLDLADLATKYSTLNEDLAKAITDIAELKLAVAGQAAALEAIGGQEGLAQVKADVATLLSNLTTLQGTVNALNAAQAQNAADIVGINATLAALQAAQANLADKASLDAVKSDLTAAEAKIDALENEIIPGINTMIAALAKSLRSLVYMPYLYIDGIETIEYPYLFDKNLLIVNEKVTMNRQRQGTPGFDEDYQKTIDQLGTDAAKKFTKLLNVYDDYQITDKSTIEYFGPAWPVEYHMNPSRATTTYSDVKGWNVRNAEVLTRSDASATIETAATYANGAPLFKNENGILTVGLKVGKPELLARRNWPTENWGRPGNWNENYPETGKENDCPQYDDIIALQVYSDNAGDTLITSDYAMVYPERATLEGLVWVKNNKLDRSKIDFDERCGYNGAYNHVWDTPKEALGAAGDNTVYPDFELPYDSEGMCLRDYLGIHMQIEGNTMHTKGLHCIELSSEKFGWWGLDCEFQLVGYVIGGNITIDSNYAEFTDADENGVSKTGTIRARNVKQDGETIDTESATSVGREPLVRVLVKRGDRVVLDGYILVHITATVTDNVLEVDNYPKKDAEFDLLCEDELVYNSNWSEFSYYVLTEKLENMTKDNFDAQYGYQFAGVPDLTSADDPTPLSDGTKVYTNVQVFDKIDGTKTTKLPGYVLYYHNDNGTTNHRFEWYMTSGELEELTHDDNYANLPRTITKYFRYTGKPGAKYKYVYVKMSFDLTRAHIAESGVKVKNANYWFSEDGVDAKIGGIYDAIALNPTYPSNDKRLADDYNSRYFRDVFELNVPQFTNTVGLAKGNEGDINASLKKLNTGNALAKYYFVPKEFEITTQKGNTYLITPRGTWNSETWNAFVCRWNGTYGSNLHYDTKDPNAWLKMHKWSDDPAVNKEIHEKCAIDYKNGVYANNYLYAYKKDASTGKYDKATPITIAYLSNSIDAGYIRLYTSSNSVAREVLNAIGYTANDEGAHQNIVNGVGEQTLTAGNNTYTFDKCETGELHTMVGIIANNGCDVAVNIDEYDYAEGATNENAGMFYVSWQRPINALNESNPLVDAKNNGDYIYTVDFLKLYDWRGPVKGYMWGDNQWLWGYYGVRYVTIDVTPANVLTNMNQADPKKFVALNSISTRVRLNVLGTDGGVYPGSYLINVSDVLNYNSATKNKDLLDLMGIDKLDNDKKLAFAGGIIYQNNGENVQDFDVIVPVTITYDWGEFTAKIKIHIGRTLGN